ncbi:MAG TPA: hypothetical protein VMA54_12560 [Steroidobacteraceae bacterium]|nr:hypothetical protein [Steroidobacteraceae bacterium]
MKLLLPLPHQVGVSLPFANGTSGAIPRTVLARSSTAITRGLRLVRLRLTGIRTKRRVVEDSLRLMIQMKRQERIRAAERIELREGRWRT